jgi:hypothetical protein
MIVLAIKMRILKDSFDFDDDMAIPLLDRSVMRYVSSFATASDCERRCLNPTMIGLKAR